ncbi:MAG: hypothetical protein KKF93_04490, partial [Candidatus Omnitrophica bacterium]|nr:hypothetical protein [Candidatus Omnitrophota bacterium]
LARRSAVNAAEGSSIIVPTLISLLKGRFGIIAELLRFLWEYKLWWITPIIIILLLLAVIITFASSTAVVPFIYTLF